MLDHFRTLTVEATQLESNNQTLESEAQSTKSLLRNAETKIIDLEHIVQNKDALIAGYEQQVLRTTRFSLICIISFYTWFIRILNEQLGSISKFGMRFLILVKWINKKHRQPRDPSSQLDWSTRSITSGTRFLRVNVQ